MAGLARWPLCLQSQFLVFQVIVIIYVIGERAKRVRNYHGCSNSSWRDVCISYRPVYRSVVDI